MHEKGLSSNLSDRFINEITSLPVHTITSIDVVPVPKDLTTKTLQKKYLGIESDIIKQQRVRNKTMTFIVLFGILSHFTLKMDETKKGTIGFKIIKAVTFTATVVVGLVLVIMVRQNNDAIKELLNW
ncbi:MAG: hypothetical protein GX660_10170 [Clostridiaceae bacterium]|mgnify:FL=1|jgi:hypothetical protein|nr:hypothetical protein [Lachnospiraceae bacterium]NLD47547.1 hypothetical protein [Clostridiaceae bacterium]